MGGLRLDRQFHTSVRVPSVPNMLGSLSTQACPGELWSACQLLGLPVTVPETHWLSLGLSSIRCVHWNQPLQLIQLGASSPEWLFTQSNLTPPLDSKWVRT